MSTTEGYCWTSQTGLKQGLPCKGAIDPASNEVIDGGTYDVLVLGAGYAGLVAARELTTAGHKTLLIEARDRIGGRTWTSEIDGYPYEMGGAWVHWNQPHIYSEIARYNLKDQLEVSLDRSKGIDIHTQIINGRQIEMSHEEQSALYRRLLTLFFNVDDNMGRTVMPFPHNSFANRKEAEKWDSLSIKDRLDQIQDQLTSYELSYLEANLLQMAGGSTTSSSFFDVLRWWALSDYLPDRLAEYLIMYKLKCGQSWLAKCIFDDAVTTGNLSYTFGDAVTSINHTGTAVSVVRSNGEPCTGRRLICTLPLNVLGDIDFRPALPNMKLKASALGHSDKMTKIHAEIESEELRSWTGLTFPGQGLLGAYGDGLTPAGNTHIVAFGADEQIHPEVDIAGTKAAFNEFGASNMKIKRLVFQNWNRDKYSKGAWCMYRPGFATLYQDALQKPHGRIRFASADWATGWRGFIDGAIEDGLKAARGVILELRQGDNRSRL